MVIAESVRITTSSDGAILLDVKQGICFSINRLGSIICDLLKTGSDRNAIAVDLRCRFPAVPVSQIEADLDTFLRALKDQKLIVT